MWWMEIPTTGLKLYFYEDFIVQLKKIKNNYFTESKFEMNKNTWKQNRFEQQQIQYFYLIAIAIANMDSNVLKP